MSSSRRSTRKMIAEDLDRRRTRESDVELRVYVRPLGSRGEHVVRHLDSSEEVVVTGPGRTHKPGSVVPTGRRSGEIGEFLLTTPPAGHRGVSNLPTQEKTGSVNVLTIYEANPALVLAGTTTTVTLTGIGFAENPLDILTAVRWNGTVWEADPLISLSAPTYVSSTTLSVDVTASASTPDDYTVSIEIVRA